MPRSKNERIDIRQHPNRDGQPFGGLARDPQDQRHGGSDRQAASIGYRKDNCEEEASATHYVQVRSARRRNFDYLRYGHVVNTQGAKSDRGRVAANRETVAE